ncbi:fibrinogen-like protein 1 [Ostrea edulis]|uniref:fibrinogen-like protein 1 n=1 Tax=Ostrea edulis TaxID=37623 RepID=UPI0024AEFCFC|nr:fibrinogen-like protein 1 [Ostrea edulis]
MWVQKSHLHCFIIACLMIHSQALKEFAYFTYRGDVSYDDQNETLSVFDLSDFMTKSRCAQNCMNNLQCNAIEVCTAASGDTCRLSSGRRDTGTAITGPLCKRFQMDDVCVSEGYIDRTTGVCIYDRDTDCNYLSQTTQISGVYIIVLDGEPKQVYCSFESGASWTVLQRRIDGSENFMKNWTDYEFGFGSFESEFWLGNKYINKLTTDSHTILRIEMEDHSGNTRYAEYSSFKVADASDNYRIQVTGYSGNAGDSFAGTCSICINGMPFSTFDKDNDNHVTLNCAVWANGGWWYNACHRSNLNGLYGNDDYAKGVNWETWKTLIYSLKSSIMKVRKL